MRILVDADACPVTALAIKIAKEYDLEIHIFFDNAHRFESNYAHVYILDQGKDSVDFFLLSKVKEKDIVITQDYGLASLALAKKAFVINNNGALFSNENIDIFLNRRYVAALARRRNDKIKGPKKRTPNLNNNFADNLRKLIEDNL